MLPSRNSITFDSLGQIFHNISTFLALVHAVLEMYNTRLGKIKCLGTDLTKREHESTQH